MNLANEGDSSMHGMPTSKGYSATLESKNVSYLNSNSNKPHLITKGITIGGNHVSQYVTEQVCDGCQDLAGALATVSLERLYLTRSIESLQTGASVGCRLCKVFMTQFDSVASDILDNHRRKRSRITTRHYPKEGYLSMTFRWKSEIWRALGIPSFTPFLFLKTTGPFDVNAWPTLQYTDNDRTWSIVRRWLTNCLNHHSGCDVPRTARRLPARLIDVGDSPDTLSPRLCLTKSFRSDIPYLTMSHCWGGLIPLRLLSSNLDTYLLELPLDQIPLKFRETMLAVQKLGFRFLWIDCLCIIQDSTPDWAEEASYMGDFYRNALCNIAANNSDSYGSSLFTSRNATSIEPCYIQVTESSGSTSDLFCIPADIWSRKVSEGPIIRRGWVVQELALAPRILYFDLDQVYWQCRSLRACEQYPDHDLALSEHVTAIPQAPVSSISHVPWITQSDARPNRNSEHVQILPATAWRTVMARYSECVLSFEEKDKLVAISGVARRFGSSSEYFAGMWEDDLPTCLLWKTWVPYRGGGARQRLETGTPSWSWASISATLDFPDTARRGTPGQDIISPNFPPYVAEVIDMQTYLETNDPFGPVTGGHVSLRGLLTNQEVTVLPDPRSTFINGRAPRYSDDKFVIACQLDSVFDAMSPDVYFFLIGNVYIHPGGWITAGLMLKRTSGKGEYRRLGMFWINTSPDPAIKGYDEVESIDAFLQSCHDFADKTTLDQVLEREDQHTGFCTIKIV